MGVLRELNHQTLQDVVNAVDSRRRQSSENQRPLLSTPLEDKLDTRLAQSVKIGAVNGHHRSENEESDWNAPFEWAIDPNAMPVDGKTLWFANTPSVAYFRNGELDDPLQHMAERMIWAMQKGTEAVAVIEIEDDESLTNLPDLMTKLVGLGVKTVVLGNELDNDPDDMDRRYQPSRLYYAGKIAGDTFERMGIKDGKIGLAAPEFDKGIPYGQSVRNQLQDVAQEENSSPFNLLTYHYYGRAEDFPAWTRQVKSSTSNIPGITYHYLTELGLPLAILSIPDPTTDEAVAGYVAKSLTLAAANPFFSKVFHHAFYDGSNERHSLAHVSGHGLIPNLSYTSYEIIAKLFANPVGQPETIEENDIMGAYGRRQRNDGAKQAFVAAWSREDQDIVRHTDEILEGSAVVYDIFGQPTGETDMITLTHQLPKILITEAS